jgi:hypothetical protein
MGQHTQGASKEGRLGPKAESPPRTRWHRCSHSSSYLRAAAILRTAVAASTAAAAPNATVAAYTATATAPAVAPTAAAVAPKAAARRTHAATKKMPAGEVGGCAGVTTSPSLPTPIC